MHVDACESAKNSSVKLKQNIASDCVALENQEINDVAVCTTDDIENK